MTHEFPDDDRPHGQLSKSLCEEDIDGGGGGGACTEVGVEERTLSGVFLNLRSSLDLESVLNRPEGLVIVGESTVFLLPGLAFDLSWMSGVRVIAKTRSKV